MPKEKFRATKMIDQANVLAGGSGTISRHIELNKWRACRKHTVELSTEQNSLLFCFSFTLLTHISSHCPLYSLNSPHPSESMILLGSIERAQLQSLLSQQLGRARRLEYIRERSLSEKKNLSVLTVPSQNDKNQRASQEVRFQVRGHCTRGHTDFFVCKSISVLCRLPK